MSFGNIFGGDGSVEKAKEAVKNGALLLDVRSPAEFAEGHIAGAQNVPVQILGQLVNELAQKHRQIVVYCRSGGRSAQAAGMLRGAGVEVFDIGPMSAWPG